MREKRILRTLPRKNSFHFFTSIGNYTGKKASSLEEFMDKINKVDIRSLEFHLYRVDFEKWIKGVLEDKILEIKIRKLREKNYTGDILRKNLYHIVKNRYKQLKKNE